MSGTYRSRSGSRGYSGQRGHSEVSSRGSGNGPRRPSIGVLVGTLVVVVAICVGAAFLIKPSDPDKCRVANALATRPRRIS